MDIFIDVFRNRPGKLISSFTALIISLFTLFMYQELYIGTLSEFFNYITTEESSKNLLLTWFLNLFSFALLVGTGITWIKDVAHDNYMDISPVAGRIISLVIGLLHLAYSILFLHFIFSDLLGIVVAAFLAYAILSSGSKK